MTNIRRARPWLIALAASAIGAHGLAATHYVRAGASGTNDGSSWEDAWSELDQIGWDEIDPGDVIEVAGGVYSGALTIGASGEPGLPITIRRATVSPYDSLVDMGPVRLGDAAHVTLDGVERYGIRVTSRGTPDVHLITDSGAAHITVRNVELEGTGYIECDSGRGMNIRASHLVVEDAYIHDFSSVGIRLIGNDTVTIRGTVLHNIRSKGDAVCQVEVGHNVHFEHIAVFDGVRDISIHDCLFSQEYSGEGAGVAGGFAVSMALNSGYARYYNNVFFNVRSGLYLNSDGFGDLTEYTVVGNTFVGFRTTIGGQPTQAANNIFCNLDSAFDPDSTRAASTAGSHNLYCHDARYTSSYQAATAAQLLPPGEHPFVDHLADWRLAQETDPGLTLPPPYDVDRSGAARGGDGTWDRGAYEHGGEDVTSPAAPRDLRLE